METPTPDKRDVRIAELEAKNTRLRDQIAARDVEIARLRHALKQALERIAELERQLGLNSENSSKPPSSDGPKDREKRPKKDGKNKQSGGAQKGHEGHYRELWPEEDVDYFEQYFPSQCTDCGLELTDEDAIGNPIRHQIFDIPPKLIVCTEHQRMACQCPGCGHITRANLPKNIAKSGWGPGLIALLAALSATCHDTRRQLDWFVREVLGAPGSVGCVQTHLEEMSEALGPVYQQVFEAVRTGHHVGVDETGWRIGRLPCWIWVIQNDAAALFSIADRRTKDVAQEVIGEVNDTIYVTDRYGAYNFLPDSQHQLCHAHLLRDFVCMSQRDGPIKHIGEKLAASSRTFQTEWAKVGAGVRELDDFTIWMNTQVRPKWTKLLKKAANYSGKATAVARWLIKNERHKMLWTFLDHSGVEPTNNGSERALRNPVIQRKISWGSQSQAGLGLMERVWTTAETCTRQGKNVLEYLTTVIHAFRGGAPAPILIECH